MLWKLWFATAGLLSLSLFVIVVLTVRRVVLDASGAKRKALRKRLIHRLLPLLSDSSAVGDLSEFMADKHLLAEVGCELLDLVRGEERQRYAEVLTRIGVKAALLERLKSGQSTQRMYAAEALAAFPGADAADWVPRLLRDRDPEVRLAGAVAALTQGTCVDLKQILRDLGSGASNSRRLVQLFEGAARRRPEAVLDVAVDPKMDRWHRTAAIEALGTLREMSAAQPLLQLAAHASELQAVSIQALGAIGHPVARDVVAAGLYSGDWEVRAASAEAAGKIGLTKTIGRLGELLDDSNWWVRLRAGNALIANGTLGEHELIILAQNTETRAGRTAALILAERVTD